MEIKNALPSWLGSRETLKGEALSLVNVSTQTAVKHFTKEARLGKKQRKALRTVLLTTEELLLQLEDESRGTYDVVTGRFALQYDREREVLRGPLPELFKEITRARGDLTETYYRENCVVPHHTLTFIVKEDVFDLLKINVGIAFPHARVAYTVV